jgi:hypothetical protein
VTRNGRIGSSPIRGTEPSVNAEGFLFVLRDFSIDKILYDKFYLKINFDKNDNLPLRYATGHFPLSVLIDQSPIQSFLYPEL